MGKYEDADRSTAKRVREPIGSRVAANVEAARKARGLSQQEVAEAMTAIGRPLAMSAVSKVEKGQRRVDPDDLVALAYVLGVNPTRLLLPDLTEDEPVALAPDLHAPAWAAWQWMDGHAPLPTTGEEEGYNTDGEVEEFNRLSRPAALRRRDAHPLVRAAAALLGRARRLAKLPHPGTLELARRDLERIKFELDDLDHQS